MADTSFRFRVGAWECFSLHDGHADFAATEFFSQTPPAELERALTAAAVEPAALPFEINLLIASNGTHQVLIDTGVGRDVGGGEGQLLARLDAVGMTPGDIDVVAITHAHWDHIGGLTDDSGRPLFPRARHVMSATEWLFWTSDEELAEVDAMLAQWAQENLPPLADQIALLDDGDEVVPGLIALAAAGHTPGQLAYLLESNDQALLHIGDVAHHPFQLAAPTINPAVETSPEESSATRLRLLEYATTNGALLMGSHFPFPGVGPVAADGEGWAWQALVAGTDAAER